MCVYVYIYIYMYTYLRVLMTAGGSVFGRRCSQPALSDGCTEVVSYHVTHIAIHINIYIHNSVDICKHLSLSIYIYMYYIYIYIHMCKHLYTYRCTEVVSYRVTEHNIIHTYSYTYVIVCVYIYIYIYI